VTKNASKIIISEVVADLHELMIPQALCGHPRSRDTQCIEQTNNHFRQSQ